MSVGLNTYNLKIARDFRGLRQNELAKKLNYKSVSKLSKIENGLKKATSQEIEEILEALNFPNSYLGLNFNSEIRNDFKYRSRKINNRTKNEIEANLHIALSIIDDLLGDELEIDSFSFDNYINDPINKLLEIDEIAHYFRKKLDLNIFNETNLISKIESLGIIVLEVEYSKLEDSRELKVDGTSAVTLNRVPVIFINKFSSNDRKKFTLAHELGHIVLHSYKVNNRKSEKEMEDEANEFASELLLPKKVVKSDLKDLNLNKLEMLKSKYGVSMGALLYKAKSLNAIPESTHKYLLIEMSRMGWLKKEPIRTNLTIDSSTTMCEILSHYYDVLDYNDEELSAMVSLNLEDFLRLKSLMFTKRTLLRRLK